MRERFENALVGVSQARVFADQRDAAGLFRMENTIQQFMPVVQMAFRNGKSQKLKDFHIHSTVRQFLRDFVDGMLHVALFDDHFVGHVAEQRQLAALFVSHRHFRAADQHVRKDADVVQDADRLLARLRFHLADGFDVRNQRQMNDDGIAKPSLVLELADGFQKRQRFDVARRAADFRHDDVDARLRRTANGLFDFIRDMRNHLDGSAQIGALPFAGDDAAVDFSARVVAVAITTDACKAFIMA